MQITAAVVGAPSAPFVIDTLELSYPRPREVLVRIVASGMCHTDLHGRDGYFPTMPYPAVFGYHEVFHACVCAAAACQYVAIALFLTSQG